MSGNVFLFWHKYDAIQRVQNMGFNPVLVNDTNTHHVRDFVPLSLEHARDCRVDLTQFERFRSQPAKGILIFHDYHVEAAQMVRNAFFPHLTGLPMVQVEALRNKLVLKRKLVEYGIPTTKFSEMQTNWHDVLAAIGTEAVIVKPKREALARGIKVIRTAAEWTTWIRQHHDEATNFYIEECLSNFTEYCCDSVVANGKILAQFTGEYTVPALESNLKHAGFGVNYPGFLPDKNLMELKMWAREFIVRHQINDGFLHMEFFWTPTGWKFGEVGWRTPGGQHLPTESEIAKNDLLDWYFRIFIEGAQRPDETLDLNNRYVGYYLVPKNPGTVKRIHADLNQPYIVNSSINVQEGETLPFEDSSVTNAAHIIYAANSLEELAVLKSKVPQLVQIDYA